MKAEKYLTLKGRILNYYPLYILLLIVVPISLVFIVTAFISSNFIVLFVAALFLGVFIANFTIYIKRARFYISKIQSNSEEIKIEYYDNDSLLSVTILWPELDYYFGMTRGDMYLVIWKNNNEILKTYRTFGNNRKTFDYLDKEFKNNIPTNRIRKLPTLSLFNSFKPTYTKSYDNIWKMH